MATGPLPNNQPDEGIIKDGALNVTRVTWWGAGAVAIITPILASILEQELTVPLQWMTTVLMVGALAAIAIVSAADILGRAWVTSTKLKTESAEPEAGKGSPTGNQAISLATPVTVKLSGKGDVTHQLISIRWDAAQEGWQYLVAGAEVLEWVSPDAVDQYIPASAKK